jgi:hypothetical protein
MYSMTGDLNEIESSEQAAGNDNHVLRRVPIREYRSYPGREQRSLFELRRSVLGVKPCYRAEDLKEPNEWQVATRSPWMNTYLTTELQHAQNSE